MRAYSHLQILTRIVVRHRILLSAGSSVAARIALQAHVPIPIGDLLVSYAALVRPGLCRLLASSYAVFLFTTPYLVLSMLLSFVYVHFYSEEIEHVVGALPMYPSPDCRHDLFLVLGKYTKHSNPRLLHIHRGSGFSLGITSIGVIGVMAMLRQLRRGTHSHHRQPIAIGRLIGTMQQDRASILSNPAVT